METMTLTASRQPSNKERAEYMGMMRTLGIEQLTVKIKGEDGESEMVLHLEKKDSEGRTLLAD